MVALLSLSWLLFKLLPFLHLSSHRLLESTPATCIYSLDLQNVHSMALPHPHDETGRDTPVAWRPIVTVCGVSNLTSELTHDVPASLLLGTCQHVSSRLQPRHFDT